MVELNEAQEKDFDELDADYQSDNDDPKVFKVRDALSPPLAMSYTAKELHSASAAAQLMAYSYTYFWHSGFIHEGFIDLNPVYQRGK